eukprot:TRINITY_DN13793_c0_g2_i1.p1 TRINITY_DN13793_c0_g2~~TRINITY_DN13793_c0_g2_i1.p1  ORF type:complete len:132 (+),score=23.87 TRINITY_DN13793_c0_g2_i1:250-645(+)
MVSPPDSGASLPREVTSPGKPGLDDARLDSMERQERDEDHLEEVIAAMQPRGASLFVQSPEGSFKDRTETKPALLYRRVVWAIVALVVVLLLAAAAIFCWYLWLEQEESSSSSVSTSALSSSEEDYIVVSI